MMNDLVNSTCAPPDPGPTNVITAMRTRRRKPTKKLKPTHYKVICISMYTQDLQQLDAKVDELKRRGFKKTSKSQLIRLALSRLTVESVAASGAKELEDDSRQIV